VAAPKVELLVLVAVVVGQKGRPEVLNLHDTTRSHQRVSKDPPVGSILQQERKKMHVNNVLM
jgi:hypothetical protein